jgi:hypothetical protein
MVYIVLNSFFLSIRHGDAAAGGGFFKFSLEEPRVGGVVVKASRRKMCVCDTLSNNLFCISYNYILM